MKNLLSSLSLLSFLVFVLINSTELKAQKPYANGCYMQHVQPGDNMAFSRPATNAACNASSAAYNSFFKVKESYIPQNGLTRPATVTKKMKIRFVVINPDPNAAQQWNFLPSDVAKLHQMVTWLNQHAANLDAPTKPSAICGSCHIVDERIRFELTDIDFITDSTNYTAFGDGQTIHGKYKDSILNIYLVVNRNFYDITNGAKVYQCGANAYAHGFYPVGAGNNYEHKIIHTNIHISSHTRSTYSEPWYTYNDILFYETRRMFHELSHILSLHHLYDDVTCNPADPEYLSDIFSGNTLTCLLDNSPGCDPYNPASNCTNNTMSKIGWYISPMQLGQVHRVSYIGSTKSYMYPTEAPTIHPWLITSNATWDFAIRMYQDIRVKAGATLTVKCEIQMPPGGKIVVEHGGKLVIDGGIITSYHGKETWLGIQAMGNMNQPSEPQYQGTVEIKNGAIIENAKEALWNFSSENGYQGGGIIKASNSFFYNNWRSVGLNGYGTFSYGNVFSGNTNCSFDHMEFRIDEKAPFLAAHNWIGGDQFTSFNTKSGVLIKNCKFINEIPVDLQRQDRRGRAIHMAATGILVSGSTFDDFKVGINSEGYSPLPTCVNYIYDNTFNGHTRSISLSAQAYGDIRGNRINHMNAYNRNAPVGILLDNTLGSFVGCDNIIDGANGDPGPLGNIGVVVNNNSPYDAATVIDNKFLNLSKGTQTQKNNPSLSILCNLYENNQLALCVNPNSAGGTLQDQGNGCGSGQFRAGNVFSGNTRDISSYLNFNPNAAWDYYYFYSSASTEQVPFNTSGYMSSNGCNFGSATTDPNSQCNKLLTCLRYFDVEGPLYEMLDAYNILVSSGMKKSYDANILRAHIIRSYGLMDDIGGMQAFLESENDDNAYRMLIPLYIDLGDYSGAFATISNLAISLDEKKAYGDYYNIIMNLKIHNRDISSLTTQELSTIRTIAASGFEISPYAIALLDWTNTEPWEHDIEEEPGILSPPVTGMHQLENEKLNSKLYEAVPNPANSYTTISVYITDADASVQPQLVLYNMMGEQTGTYDLKPGENKIAINTENLATGLYIYSLTLQGSIVQNRKLVITK